MKVVLIGFSASGKSAAGALLAEKLSLKFIDTDWEIVKTHGSVQGIFARMGEYGFRRLEEEVLLRLRNEDNCVIACGGGSVLCPAFCEAAKNAFVVWLRASAQAILSRLDGSRPLLRGLDENHLRAFMAERESVYKSFAGSVVDTSDKTPAETADSIAELLKNASDAAQR